jgi:hypothetical protein
MQHHASDEEGAVVSSAIRVRLEERKNNLAEHVKKGMSAPGNVRERLDGHAVDREAASRCVAFQWEIRMTTGSDAEQPKDGES